MYNDRQCQYCFQEFKLQLSVEQHEKFCSERPVGSKKDQNRKQQDIQYKNKQTCPFCKKDIFKSQYNSHVANCKIPSQSQKNNIQEYDEEEKQDHEASLPCPVCDKMVKKSSLSGHIDECFKKTQKIKCESCQHMIESERYEGHVQRCQDRKLMKEIMKNYKQEQQKDLMTESMLQDPSIAFLQCIYCQKDIVESRYEEHLIKCETQENCNICRQSYPVEIYHEHRKMCELQMAMQMGGLRAVVQCEKCQKIVPASVFEAHQLMHFQEDGFDGQVIEQPKLDPSVQKKIDSILNDPGNKQLNNMTDDELYKHFHDIDLEEFQKKSGLQKDEVSNNLNSTFYITKDDDNDEDKLCLICQEDFQNRDKIRRLTCKHQFHEKCVDEWLSRNAICPVCRKDIKQDIQQNILKEINQQPSFQKQKIQQQQQQQQQQKSSYNNNWQQDSLSKFGNNVKSPNSKKPLSNFQQQQQQRINVKAKTHIQQNQKPSNYQYNKTGINTQKRSTLVSNGTSTLNQNIGGIKYMTSQTQQSNNIKKPISNVNTGAKKTTGNSKLSSNSNLDKNRKY